MTARSAAKGGPEFGVCRLAEAALGKLSLGGCAKRFDWPPVVATSEKPASVLSGGEFPILIPVTDGRVAVKWKRFGYWAEVVPRWLETGRLQLDITPEIVTKDFAHAVTANGLTIPGLTTRRVCARMELNLGRNGRHQPRPGAHQPGRRADARARHSQIVQPRVATSERPWSAASRSRARTITLFLVTPTAARPCVGRTSSRGGLQEFGRLGPLEAAKNSRGFSPGNRCETNPFLAPQGATEPFARRLSAAPCGALESWGWSASPGLKPWAIVGRLLARASERDSVNGLL